MAKILPSASVPQRRRRNAASEDKLSPDAPVKFGVLQPQEVILGMLGEYAKSEQLIWSGGLVSLLGDLGFSPAASRIALNRVVARDLLEPLKEGRFVYYRSTPRLLMVQNEGRRQTFSPTADVKWNGQWTLVWYSIPEEHRPQRTRLGKWLNFRGFGALQDGTWIAAGNCEDDIAPLIKKLGLEQHVIVIVGELGRSTPLQSLVNRGWRLDELAQMYAMFAAEFTPFRAAQAIKHLSAREAFVLRTRLIEMFRQTAVLDPNLPDAVLGMKWQRREAVLLFQDIQQSLKQPAQDYFNAQAIDVH